MKELLDFVSTLVVVSVGLVERPAVVEKSRHVGNEQVLVDIVVVLQAVAYSLQVCQHTHALTQSHDDHLGSGRVPNRYKGCCCYYQFSKNDLVFFNTQPVVIRLHTGIL